MPTILLGVFLSQIVGFSIYFNLEKGKIRKQLKTYIKEGVPKNELKIFTFTNLEFSKLIFTKKKEFKIDNNFYDIVYTSKDSTGNLLLQCVDDKQESRLFRNLSAMVDFNLGNENNDSPLSFIFTLLKTPFSVNSFSPIIPKALILEGKKKLIFSYLEFFSDVHKQISTPPPNFNFNLV